MDLHEMFQRVLIQSGQFLIAQDNIELNEDRFVIIVRMALGILNKYDPVIEHRRLTITGTRQYTFTEVEGIPEYVSDLVPFRVSGMRPFLLRPQNRNSSVTVKESFPWVYRKPTLTVPVSAEYDSTLVFYHKVISTEVEGKIISSVETIDHNTEHFFDLLTAYFLKGIGRSRRAFTLNELTITSDASDLVAEGKELEETTVNGIIENDMQFYLAWR